MHIKDLLFKYVSQLEKIIEKVPDELFSKSLAEDMFSLEMNAKIAVNFVLRGYCPFLETEAVSFSSDDNGKLAVIKQIKETKNYLNIMPEVMQLDDSKMLTDKAGFADVKLSQSNFLYQYIIPNCLFHISMVYAIARSHGVPLSKDDFDGFHHYPGGFSFQGSS